MHRTNCMICKKPSHSKENPLIVIDKGGNVIHFVHKSCLNPMCQVQFSQALSQLINPAIPNTFCKVIIQKPDAYLEVIESFKEDEKTQGYTCVKGDKIGLGKAENAKFYVGNSREPLCEIGFLVTNSVMDCFKCIYFCEKPCDNPEDPLISICKCKGSGKYVHYCCLKAFIESKFKPKEETKYVEYAVDGKCQLCHADICKK